MFLATPPLSEFKIYRNYWHSHRCIWLFVVRLLCEKVSTPPDPLQKLTGTWLRRGPSLARMIQLALLKRWCNHAKSQRVFGGGRGVWHFLRKSKNWKFQNFDSRRNFVMAIYLLQHELWSRRLKENFESSSTWARDTFASRTHLILVMRIFAWGRF